MAVVGHAYVVVRAITNGVEGDIRRAFSGSRINNAAMGGGRSIGNALVRGLTDGTKDIDNNMTRAAKSFRAFYPEADRLRKAFVNAMRAGYAFQAGIGALGGSISAAIGGLTALIGAAGGAAAALVAVGSAALTARIGLGIAQYALGGISAAVKAATSATGGYTDSTKDLREQLQQLRFDQEEAEISVDRAAFNLEKARQNMLRTADLAPNSLVRRDAELAFREAELAYRRAKDRQEDLKEGLAEDGTAGGGGTDPFAGLTPSQKAFAEWLISVQDIFKDLKEAAASGFLPILQEQLQRLIDSPLIDILEDKFYKIGEGAGLAVKEFVDKVLESENLRDLDTFLGNVAETLPSFGRVIGNVYDSILSVLVAADPLTRKFVAFLEEKSGGFADWLDVKQANGDLERFFNRAGEVAAKFGTIFGGIFNGLGDIIMANFGPGSGGDRLLDWLGEATTGFANIDKVFLSSYFQGTADNFMAIGTALGGAIETLVKAGDNPSIKAFWDALDAGSLAFDTIVNNFVDSAPTFGDTLRLLTEIFAVFSDSGQVEQFFSTLNFFLSGTKDILVGLGPLIDFVGPILASVSAVGLLIAIGTKLSLVFGSFLASAIGGFGILRGTTAAQTVQTVTLTAAQNGLTVAVKATDVATKSFMATNPIGWALLAVSAIAAIGVAIASVRSNKVEEATKGFTAAFDEGKFSLEGFSEVAKDLGGYRGIDIVAGDVDTLRGSIKDLSVAQESFWSPKSFETTVLADAFGAVGRSLGNIAITDLPKAQKGFKEMRKELGNLTRNEMIVALDEMDEFKDALVTQADQLGINIYNLDGTVDKQKLLNLALGEGEYAARLAAEQTRMLNEKLAAQRKALIEANAEWENQSLTISGWGDVFKDAMTEIEDGAEVFDFKKALANMEKAVADSTQLEKDMLELRLKGMSDAGIEMVKSAGANAPALVKALIDASEEEFNRFSALADRQIIQQSEKFGEAKQTLIDAYADKKIDETVFNALYNGLEAASDPTTLGIVVANIHTELSKIPDVTVKIVPKVDSTVANQHLRDLANSFSVNVPGVTRRANGGFITGPGGPRSDLIPAMLSNGEYVVNARATSRYRGLLERINAEGNRFADGGMVGKSGMGAGINITVNPSPGMNEKELAAAVSRQLAFEIRKGSI